MDKSLEVGSAAPGLLTWQGRSGGCFGRRSRIVFDDWELVSSFLTHLSPKFGTTALI